MTNFCHKHEFVVSGQFLISYCSTWLTLLVCFIKKLVIKELVIRVMQCISLRLPVGIYNVFLCVTTTMNLYYNLY